MLAASRRAVRSGLAWGLATCALLAGGGTVRAEPQQPSACPDSGAAVVVLTRVRELWLCSDGAATIRFAVAIGRGGPGKRTQGDERTPLGEYPLGEPRTSSRYGTFIPIAYPTPEQVAHGFSGSHIGIHGPPRKFSAIDYPVVEIDWTSGCIATATDDDVAAIADFVRSRRPSVVIR
jgi:hypothetical protein